MANEIIEGTPIAENLRLRKEKCNAPYQETMQAVAGIRAADKTVGWGWFLMDFKNATLR